MLKLSAGPSLKRTAILVLFSLILAVPTSQAAEIDHRLSPKELVALAQAFNEQLRFTEAADLLERALMINPNVANGLSAYQKALQGIQNNKKTDENSRGSKLRASWQVSKQLSVKVGSSSNLNRAPSSSVIPLTVGSQIVDVALADDETAKQGQAIELGVSIAAQTQLGAKDAVVLSAQLQQRKAMQTGFTNYQWGTLAAMWARELPKNHQIIGGVSIDILNYQQQAPYYIVQAALRYKSPLWQQCSQQYGVEIESQGQQNNKALDGRYLGAVLAFSCRKQNMLYTAQLSAGQDWAVGKRLGGDQQVKKIQFSHVWAIGENTRQASIRTTIDYYQQQDQSGYNDLLNAGSNREVKRINLALEYERPLTRLGKHWLGFINIEWTKQRSNIALFETNTKELWLGLKRNW